MPTDEMLRNVFGQDVTIEHLGFEDRFYHIYSTRFVTNYRETKIRIKVPSMTVQEVAYRIRYSFDVFQLQCYEGDFFTLIYREALATLPQKSKTRTIVEDPSIYRHGL